MMNSRVCEMLGIEFPLFAFSHCRDVVAEVSKAGGFGVLGGAGHTPESLDIELTWIDEQVNGAPYGVDIIVPTSMDAKEGGLTPEEVEARIPPEHKGLRRGHPGQQRHRFPRPLAAPPQRLLRRQHA